MKDNKDEPRRGEKAGESTTRESTTLSEKHGGGYEHGRHKHGTATEVSASQTKRKGK